LAYRKDPLKKAAALSANSVASQAASLAAAAAVAAVQAKPVLRDTLTRTELLHFYEAWQRDCQIDNHSAKTKSNYDSVFGLLLWHLEQNHLAKCGPDELRSFLAYLTEPRLVISDDEGTHGRGRWGYEAKNRPSTADPVSALTIRTYYGRLRAMFNWIVEQGELDISPLAKIKLAPDRGKKDRIQPYSKDQKLALLRAARRSSSPVRDRTIVMLFLSTGMRARELCMLDVGDFDITMKRVHIRFGKGGKQRMVNFGRRTAKALFDYKSESRKGDAPKDTPFFTSERGGGYGQRLTPGGVHQMVARLIEAEGITGIRRIVHSFRHTFAVDFLLRGGLPNELQRILGHEDPEMTMAYVNFAQACSEERHIRLDPVDGLDKEL
jgi:integrase